MAYETRLLRLQSQDKNDPADQNSSFSVDYGSVGANLGLTVKGISIESVTFPNFLPTLFRLNRSLTFKTILGPHPGIHTIGPIGTIYPDDDSQNQMNLTEFVVLLQAAFDAVVPGETTWLQVAGNGTNRTLSVTINSAATFFVPYVRNSLGYHIGFIPPRDQVWESGQTYYFTSQLQGMEAVYLHSTSLTSNRLGLDSQGPGPEETKNNPETWAALAVIPITVPRGVTQTLDNTQLSIQRPTLLFGPSHNPNLATVHVSLRDSDQQIIGLGPGELTVVMRLWFTNT